jgi:hypothetical protein
MSNKTISINPALFKLAGSKTRKTRDKKEKPASIPLISPNVLKNKLLKRIKEHKQKETQGLGNNKIKIPAPPKQENIEFTDEFTDSINYLQTLSKQKQVDEEKRKNQILKEELERKTLKNYHSLDSPQPLVNIDLPEDLMPATIKEPVISEPFMINEKNDKDDPPYGILKRGFKPSYREWIKTQRNNIVTNPNASLVIEGGNLHSQKTARENRLNLLKQKIKSKEVKTDPLLEENLIKKPDSQLQQTGGQLQQTGGQLQVPASHPQISSTELQQSAPQLQQPQNGKIIGTKHITKKTIKRKYTLGRSRIKKTVSVLIKDRNTRKKVLNAQKDLKRKNINDIRVYLREHNLIKTGSNAPNDVLRKLYESAMLTGEITNSNLDTLLHNFSKEDKEL